jgi:DNA-binding HxlR family transcriptional regulator
MKIKKIIKISDKIEDLAMKIKELIKEEYKKSNIINENDINLIEIKESYLKINEKNNLIKKLYEEIFSDCSIIIKNIENDKYKIIIPEKLSYRKGKFYEFRRHNPISESYLFNILKENLNYLMKNKIYNKKDYKKIEKLVGYWFEYVDIEKSDKNNLYFLIKENENKKFNIFYPVFSEPKYPNDNDKNYLTEINKIYGIKSVDIGLNYDNDLSITFYDENDNFIPYINNENEQYKELRNFYLKFYKKDIIKGIKIEYKNKNNKIKILKKLSKKIKSLGNKELALNKLNQNLIN